MESIGHQQSTGLNQAGELLPIPGRRILRKVPQQEEGLAKVGLCKFNIYSS